MQDIKELVHFIVNNKHLLLDESVLQFEKGGKLGRLFNGLVLGEIETDEDALIELYASKEENSGYRKLKSILRERMLQSLLYLDLSSELFTEFQRAYYDCHRQWLYVKILTGQNVNVAAISLAKRLLKQTMNYDFVQLSMDICSYLRVQYALRTGDDKLYAEMSGLFIKFREIFDAESLAEELYTLIVARHINSRSPLNAEIEKIEHSCSQLEPLLQRFDSYRLHLYGRLLLLMRYTMTNRFTTALEVCDESIQFFESKPFEARVPILIFLYEKLICQIQLRQFDAGRQTAHQCMKYLKNGTFNWFKYQELALKLELYTQHYQRAFDLMREMTAHPKYQFLPENVKEMWRIYEAYLYFLILLGKVKPPMVYQFKPAKFMNEVPIFSRDKAGMNIAIQIIRFLLMIAERKYEQLYDVSNPLSQYAYRYLNTSQTRRSFNFIKAMVHLPAGQFDWLDVEKKTKRYLDQLKKLPLQVADQIDEIEIIPYETLWDLIREMNLNGHVPITGSKANKNVLSG